MKQDILTATLQSNDPLKTRAIRANLGVGSTNIGTITPDTIFKGIKRVTVETPDDVPLAAVGDVWWFCEAVTVKEDKTLRNGWVAERHLGKNYLTVTLVTDTTPPPAAPVFPESFILTNPADGTRAEYAFVKVLE